MADADRRAAETGGSLTLLTDPLEAAAGADIVVTDTWVSMGKEEEKLARLRDLGAYKVTGELGRGGMALVLRAEHEHLGRPVAIKELLERGRDKEAEARFFREAQALSQFHHENIVTLYDLVEKNDSFFMVMELVDGPTLDQIIRTGPLPGEVAAVIVAPTLKTLR